MTRDREPHVDYVLINRSNATMGEESKYVEQLPALKDISRLDLHPKVTFFIGENGSGKSTLLEAIAVADGFNAEGGTRNFNFASRASHSDMFKWIRLGRGARGKRRSDGFFVRAESFYNVASEIERLGLNTDARSGYGTTSLHNVSHGEAFIALITTRMTGDGLYLFDEPESALSPQRQLAFLVAMHELIDRESQFVIATHSPILMAYPDAWIYEFSPAGVNRVAYEETEHYRVMHTFMTDPQRTLRHLLADD